MTRQITQYFSETLFENTQIEKDGFDIENQKKFINNTY